MDKPVQDSIGKITNKYGEYNIQYRKKVTSKHTHSKCACPSRSLDVLSASFTAADSAGRADVTGCFRPAELAGWPS